MAATNGNVKTNVVKVHTLSDEYYLSRLSTIANNRSHDGSKFGCWHPDPLRHI